MLRLSDHHVLLQVLVQRQVFSRCPCSFGHQMAPECFGLASTYLAFVSACCPWPELQARVCFVINFKVCVFLFLLSLHPAGARALREQREVSQQRLLLKRASLGARDAVEWSVGVWEVVLPTSPKVYLILLAFFAWCACFRSLSDQEETVCFSGVFQFCKCSQP